MASKLLMTTLVAYVCFAVFSNGQSLEDEGQPGDENGDFPSGGGSSGFSPHDGGPREGEAETGTENRQCTCRDHMPPPPPGNWGQGPPRGPGGPGGWGSRPPRGQEGQGSQGNFGGRRRGQGPPGGRGPPGGQRGQGGQRWDPSGGQGGQRGQGWVPPGGQGETGNPGNFGRQPGNFQGQQGSNGGRGDGGYNWEQPSNNRPQQGGFRGPPGGYSNP